MSLRPLFFAIFLENYKSFSKSQGESRENYRVEKIVNFIDMDRQGRNDIDFGQQRNRNPAPSAGTGGSP
ncbi:hypothetical protein TorRG33x02_028240 [Trema orientale]|uniref:Uncharacterized protein n=1 Tax=Trema orientale TaxID=63057 RepID=A0A2P5FUT4_TREOI|nr:hypothetical protein TorRG33x02_028240 [Trema orientale]